MPFFKFSKPVQEIKEQDLQTHLDELTLPERELGAFPFQVLFDEPTEQSSIRFFPVINFVLLLVLLIAVFAK